MIANSRKFLIYLINNVHMFQEILIPLNKDKTLSNVADQNCSYIPKTLSYSSRSPVMCKKQ